MKGSLMLRFSFIVLGLLVTGLTASSSRSIAQSATPVADSGIFSGRIDIGGGRHLYHECRGSGAPTVILEAGFRSPETVWTEDLAEIGAKSMVLPGVAS